MTFLIKYNISFQDEKKVDLELNSASVSLRTLPALDDNAVAPTDVAAEDFGVIEHPEILVSLIFMEKLSPNESLKVRCPLQSGKRDHWRMQ